MRNKLLKSFTNKLTSFNLKVVLTSPTKVNGFFHINDILPKMLLLGLDHKYKYRSCNDTYYDKIEDHFKVRICEYLGISQIEKEED